MMPSLSPRSMPGKPPEGKGNEGGQSFARFSKSLARPRFRHAASQPARCPDLPVSTCRCSGRAIFDFRALLTPPLAAERMVRLSTRMGFRAEVQYRRHLRATPTGMFASNRIFDVKRFLDGKVANLSRVIPEIDIWRAATLMLIRQYGTKAFEASAARAVELAAQDDHNCAAVWRRMTDAVGNRNCVPALRGRCIATIRHRPDW